MSVTKTVTLFSFIPEMPQIVFSDVARLGLPSFYSRSWALSLSCPPANNHDRWFVSAVPYIRGFLDCLKAISTFILTAVNDAVCSPQMLRIGYAGRCQGSWRGDRERTNQCWERRWIGWRLGQKANDRVSTLRRPALRCRYNGILLAPSPGTLLNYSVVEASRPSSCSIRTFI